MHKNHETAEIILFFIFTWLPFQIVFLSAHLCKETNYGQTEIIKLEKKKRKKENFWNKNRIGVQRLVVMPSKLWRFEWSWEGIEVLCYDFPKSGTYIYLILLLKTPLGHFYTRSANSVLASLEPRRSTRNYYVRKIALK